MRTLNLRGYFHGSKLHMTCHPNAQSIVNNEYLANGYTGSDQDANNPYSGTVHFPQWNVYLQSQGRNYRPSSDHHYLAKDAVSPPSLHGNVSQVASESLALYMQKCPCAHAPVPPHTVRMICVPSPEDPAKARTFKVAVLVVPQVIPTAKVQHKRGHTVASNFELSRSIILRDNFIKNVNAILVLGTFDLEARPCPPKILSLQFPALQSSVSTSEATYLLSILGSSSGKQGFELSRTYGSSGMVCAQSDRDMTLN